VLSLITETKPWGLDAFTIHIPSTTPDLLLKHLDTTLATYKKRHMKHLKYAKTIENHCKHMQHPEKTLATYV
jgi:hypothetical protein